TREVVVTSEDLLRRVAAEKLAEEVRQALATGLEWWLKKEGVLSQEEQLPGDPSFLAPSNAPLPLGSIRAVFLTRADELRRRLSRDQERLAILVKVIVFLDANPDFLDRYRADVTAEITKGG